MRLFIALLASSEVRTEVESILEPLRGIPGVRWVAPETVHWTLHFFGPTDPARVPEIVSVMRETAAGASPFELALGPAGAFPSPTQPNILWLGAGDGAEALETLAGRLHGALKSRGFDVESRPFKAHLTVGRARSGGGGPTALDALRLAAPASRMRAEDIVLMESRLGPKGSTFAVVERAPLGARP